MKRTVTITDNKGFVASLYGITKVEVSSSGTTWFFFSGDNFVAALGAWAGLAHDFPEVTEEVSGI